MLPVIVPNQQKSASPKVEWARPKLPITVINDTPATYLSGSTTIANNYANGFAGLVNGTGTNTCCLLPVRAIEKLGRDADGEMLVNLESGSFTDVPQSAFDKALDAASPADVQTGPAVRNDTGTRARHCALLDDDLQLKNIYSIISNSIWETSKKI